MAKIQAASLRTRTPNGTYGVLSKCDGTAELAATPVNDVVHVISLDAGVKFYGLKAHYAALGASTGFKVGYSYPMGEAADVDDAFVTVADSSSAGVAEWSDVPFVTKYPLEITVTVTGAAATGNVVVIPEYEFQGK